MGAALIVISSMILLGFVAWLASRVDSKPAELRRLRKIFKLHAVALDEIEAELDTYSDIDSPLAAKLRPIVRKVRQDRNEIEAS